jgi:hypothetical protein
VVPGRGAAFAGLEAFSQAWYDDCTIGTITNQGILMKITLGLLFLLTIVGTGCVSTAAFDVSHEKLKAPAVLQEGTIALAPFKDSRAVTNSNIIGGVGDVANPKPKYITGQGRPLSEIMTDDFREALEKCGYQVRTSPSSETTRTLHGEISEFWLSGGWKGLCRTRVVLKLKDSDTGPSLWEKTLTSEEDDLMIIPNAMRAAMNSLLKEAIATFSSKEFADAVRGKPAASGQ